jgi:hypothetical protein
MPPIYAPGVAQTVLSGTIGTQPWAVLYHWKPASSSEGWSQVDLGLLAQTVFEKWTSTLAFQAATNVSLHQVAAADLTDSAGLTDLYIDSPSHGQESGVLMPSSLCVVVQNIILSRYRGGHPRTYWPFGSEDDLQDEAHWTPGFASGVADAVAQFVSQIVNTAFSFGSSELNHVCLRYQWEYNLDEVHHKYNKIRTGLLGVFPVQGYNGDVEVGTQRRRLTTT